MTEKRSKSPASAAKGRSKHAAPTIDLTATEVQSQEATARQSRTKTRKTNRRRTRRWCRSRLRKSPKSRVEQEAVATEAAAPESSEHAQAALETAEPRTDEARSVFGRRT